MPAWSGSGGSPRWLPLIALLAVACAGPERPTRARDPQASAPRTPRRAHEGAAPVAWPRGGLVVGEHEGPTLLRRADPASTGFAWIAPGAVVRLRGAPRRRRVRAYVDGPVRVRGWIRIDALEAVVLRRGRVGSTPVFVVPGDRVRLRDVGARGALVEARARFAHPELSRSPAFAGPFALEALGAAVAGVGAGASAGRSARLRAGGPLYDRPEGEPVWQLPALDPPLTVTVLRDDGDWLGVRLGVGPYLVGFVPRSRLLGDGAGLAPAGASKGGDSVVDPWSRARPLPCWPGAAEVLDPWRDEEAEPEPRLAPEQATEESVAEAPDPDALPVPLPVPHPVPPTPVPLAEGDLPARLSQAAVRPVWRVAPATRVRVGGATMAIFREEGRAVELGRRGDWVEVIAAVDDDVTLRGEVRADRLSRL